MTLPLCCRFLAQTTHILELISFGSAIGILMVTLLLVMLSYTYIMKTILNILSAQKITKAFPTCSSHMIVVSLTYGSCIFSYMQPSAKERVTLSKGVAVIYTSVAPVLNTFSYTLGTSKWNKPSKIYSKIFTCFSINEENFNHEILEKSKIFNILQFN